MEIFQGILLGVFWIGGIIFMRSITTFFHEMGHAIPALLFTQKEKVRVFVGTYGDLSNCLQLNFGRLILYLKLNIFNWRIGLCAHGGIKGLIPQIITILGGPIASLAIASTAFYFIFTKNWSESWIIFIVFFLVSAIIDFIVNIDPTHKPIKLYDGSVTYSDGYQLIRAFKRKNLPDAFFEAEKLLYQNKPTEAIEMTENLINSGNHQKPLYDLLIKSYIAKQEYGKAVDVYEIIKGVHKYDYTDFYQLGFLNLKLNRWEEATSYFDHCIYQKHTDALAINQRGYIRMQQGKYQEALKDLEAAVTYGPDNPEAWSNRGLLKVKMRQPDSALQDLEIAYKIDPTNPNVLHHLGLYHESERHFKEALSFFKQAKEQGLDFHGIDLKIAEMEQMVDAFF